MAGITGDAEITPENTPEVTAEPTATTTAEPTTALATKEPNATVEPTMADVLKEMQAIKAMTGRISDLSSKVDKMPKAWESTLEKRLREQNENSYLQSLAPEDRKAYEQAKADREFQQKELEKIIEAKIEARKGGLDEESSKFVQELRAEREDSKRSEGFFQKIESTLGPDDSKRLLPYIGDFLKWHEKAINGTDETEFKKAAEAMEDALKNPDGFILGGLKWLQQQTSQGGQQVQQQRVERGKSLSLAPRGSASKSGSMPLNLKAMTAKELQADPRIAEMSTSEYEALLKASK